jgi:hypothetical protein
MINHDLMSFYCSPSQECNTYCVTTDRILALENKGFEEQQDEKTAVGCAAAPAVRRHRLHSI